MRRGVLILVASLLTVPAAFGAELVPDNQSALEKRLASYDPKAVAAARHYFQQPAMKAGMIAMVDNVEKAMGGIVAQQNPGIGPEKLARLQSIAGEVMKERIDLLLEMNMVIALDAFTTGELVALDGFYSSPEGQQILVKMPKMTAQLPAIMKGIMPSYLAEVKAKMKANGAELRL